MNIIFFRGEGGLLPFPFVFDHFTTYWLIFYSFLLWWNYIHYFCCCCCFIIVFHVVYGSEQLQISYNKNMVNVESVCDRGKSCMRRGAGLFRCGCGSLRPRVVVNLNSGQRELYFGTKEIVFLLLFIHLGKRGHANN